MLIQRQNLAKLIAIVSSSKAALDVKVDTVIKTPFTLSRDNFVPLRFASVYTVAVPNCSV